MLGFAPTDTLAPEAEAAGLQLLSHYSDHVLFLKPIQAFDSFERRAVFPGHFDDAGKVGFLKTYHQALPHISGLAQLSGLFQARLWL